MGGGLFRVSVDTCWLSKLLMQKANKKLIYTTLGLDGNPNMFDVLMRAFHSIDICFSNTDLMLPLSNEGARPRNLSSKMLDVLLKFMRMGYPYFSIFHQWNI